MFPNLFALIEAKEATVAYLWEQREGGSLELPFCKESKWLRVGFNGAFFAYSPSLVDE